MSATPQPFAAFEWLIAWRYLRARRKEGGISVIAWYALVGVMLGVATLIVAPVIALWPGLFAEVYLLAMTVVLLVGPLLSLVLGLRYLRTLP